jgi:hypothetical protein
MDDNHMCASRARPEANIAAEVYTQGRDLSKASGRHRAGAAGGRYAPESAPHRVLA